MLKFQGEDLHRLYHGTSMHDFESILTHGIRPQESPNHTAPSHPECVYLATARGIAPFYAVLRAKRTYSRAVILEIDTSCLKSTNVYPDEDNLANFLASAEGNGGRSIDEQVLMARDRLFEHAHFTESSLLYGSCAYRGTVPPDAIRRAMSFTSSKDRALTCFWMGENFLLPGDNIETISLPILENNKARVLEGMLQGQVTASDISEGLPTDASFASIRQAVEADVEADKMEILSLNPDTCP